MTDERIAVDAPQNDVTDVSKSSDELMIPVDPEPSSFRFTVLGLFLSATVVGYAILASASSAGMCSPLAFFGGLAFGVAVMYGSERLLKPRWKSHRFVHVSTASIRSLSKNEPRSVIDPALPVNVLQWQFQTQRRTRVPKGWHVVAIALEQDDIYLPAYALISPEDFAALDNSRFMKLSSRKELKKHKDSDLRRAGVQRRLATAEYARSIDGVEMLPDDFTTYLNWLEAHCPDWFSNQ
jgi:hypothetical protein